MSDVRDFDSEIGRFWEELARVHERLTELGNAAKCEIDIIANLRRDLQNERDRCSELMASLLNERLAHSDTAKRGDLYETWQPVIAQAVELTMSGAAPQTMVEAVRVAREKGMRVE